jgi:diadenylate cyclase
MKSQRVSLIESAFQLSQETLSDSIFLFFNTAQACSWFLKSPLSKRDDITLIVPSDIKLKDRETKPRTVKIVRSWSGNQTRFSRIKYAFLHGVLQGVITTDSKVVCVLGPWGKDHLDTIAIHDLSLSWAEEFPFDPRLIMQNKSFSTVLAVVDIALDIGALGREGKAIGTTFVIGDTEHVLRHSHQAVFNPFKGYPKKERLITRSEVVESVKELAKLDGAFVITETGMVMAAGRHLDARSLLTKQLRGLGSRHRTAAGISRMTDAVAIVVSESTGRVIIFEKGKIVSTLEPVISSRLV